MKKITVTTTSFGEYDKEVLAPLAEQGYEIIMNPYGRKLKKEEIDALCRNSVGIIAGTEALDGQALERLPGLKIISRCGAGMDNVDLPAAKKRGIRVFNTPDAPTLAVAELSVGLILDMLRGTSRMDREIRSGVWKKHMGSLLSGKDVGIIGFGKIGRRVAEMLVTFGCTIRCCDIAYGVGEVFEIRGAAVERVELNCLLKTCDIISVHVSDKRKILGLDELGQMKNGAWLVNTSRGGVIDEQALYDALKNGPLSGAALDVFAEEPYEGPLTELPNIVLTTHIGSYARESRIAMERQSVENLCKGLKEIVQGGKKL